MKILSITNNYGYIEDGIGYYSKRIVDEIKKDNIDFEILTDKTVGFSKAKRILSLRMAKCFSKAKKRIKEEKIDKIIIEYPFVEENPIIMSKIKSLHRKCKKNNVELILSLHEYLRVAKLKRFYIRSICKHVDKVMVTDENNLNALVKYNKNIFIRHIPVGIIWDFDNDYKKQSNKFVYFGLINKAKAFNEMIDAWKDFNKDKSFFLEILTASKIDDIDDDTIKIFKGLSDEEIASHMSDAAYSILPIKPEIYLNNSSFLTSAQAGCVCIGIFSDRISNNSFMVNLNSYDKDEFVNGLKKAIDLLGKQSFDEAQKFGSSFTMKNVAKEIEEIIKK